MVGASTLAGDLKGILCRIRNNFYSFLLKEVREWEYSSSEIRLQLAMVSEDRFEIIKDWDAGWYQIRMALRESLNLKALSAKLLPRIHYLGFLKDEVRYFT